MASSDDLTDDGSIASLRIVWMEPPTGLRLFPLDHPYIELVYTPLVGASAVLFLRRIALLANDSSGIDLDAIVLSRELGLRAGADRRLGRNSPFVKALRRLEHHRLARWLAHDRLGVYRQVPALADEHLPGLPESARRVHQRYIRT
jgi:hypothetical protein